MGPYLCCCILIYNDGQEATCGEETSGPDDPFCRTCTTRHVENTDPRIKITQRLRSNR
jgi:hypothetical protein